MRPGSRGALPQPSPAEPSQLGVTGARDKPPSFSLTSPGLRCGRSQAQPLPGLGPGG